MKEVEFEEKFLKKKIVAQMLSCSTRTVDRFANSGKLPRYRIGNMCRFKESDVLAMIERK